MSLYSFIIADIPIVMINVELKEMFDVRHYAVKR
jgi:hypothetical protein